MSGSALVLGGGGVTGIAWELGMIAGLADAGVDLAGADLVVGTSAGSVVGAQITSGKPIEELYERELRPPAPGAVARFGTRQTLVYGLALLRSRGDLIAFGRRLGALSIKAAAAGRTPSLDERLAAIKARLPVLDWPDRDLRVTVVDAHSGEFRTFGRDGGVPLVEAIAASCAVPGVYPPVPIGDRSYIDGGARTSANADVAQGCARIVVLTPMTRRVRAIPNATQQVQELAVPAVVIGPDRDAVAAIGKNVLDPAARARTARAGRAQAAKVVDQIRAVWEGRAAAR
jgi:NTE family protein